MNGISRRAACGFDSGDAAVGNWLARRAGGRRQAAESVPGFRFARIQVERIARRLSKIPRSHYNGRAARGPSSKAKTRNTCPVWRTSTRCDVMLLFTRRLKLSGEQLERIKSYCQSGKPIVGVRTASHAIQTWLDLDKEVLGGNYHGHYAEGPRTEIAIVEVAKNHPILAGFQPYRSAGSLYKNEGLAADNEILLPARFPTIPNRSPGRGRTKARDLLHVARPSAGFHRRELSPPAGQCSVLDRGPGATNDQIIVGATIHVNESMAYGVPRRRTSLRAVPLLCGLRLACVAAARAADDGSERCSPTSRPTRRKSRSRSDQGRRLWQRRWRET